MNRKPKGLQATFDDIRADYDMTRQSRFVRRRVGVAAQGSDENYHFRTESKYYEAIEQARDMDRNDGLVGILADRRVDNIRADYEMSRTSRFVRRRTGVAPQ